MAKPQKKTIHFTERSGVLRQNRNLKMAGSAHAYVRGNTRKFYEWLDTTDNSRFRRGRQSGYAAIVMSEIWDRSPTATGLMPIADFLGWFGWDYDDVDLFAPTRFCGPPDHLSTWHAHVLGIVKAADCPV